MEVLRVVPLDEVGEPSTGMLDGSEAVRVADGVLQGLVPRLNEGVVIAAPGPGVTPHDLEGVQEDGQRDAPHRIPVVGVNDLGADPQVANDPQEEQLGVLLRLGRLDDPAHDASVKEVDDRVGVEEDSADLGLQPGDVPRPDLVRTGD